MDKTKCLLPFQPEKDTNLQKATRFFRVTPFYRVLEHFQKRLIGPTVVSFKHPPHRGTAMAGPLPISGYAAINSLHQDRDPLGIRPGCGLSTTATHPAAASLVSKGLLHQGPGTNILAVPFTVPQDIWRIITETPEPLEPASGLCAH